MADLLIKEAELQKLDELIQPIPTKYGFGIVAFFQNISQLRANEAAAEKKALEQLPQSPGPVNPDTQGDAAAN
jgi:hypothetical protein